MKTSCCFFFWPLPSFLGPPRPDFMGFPPPFLLEMNNLPSLRMELPPEWVPRTVFRLERAVIPLLDARMELPSEWVPRTVFRLERSVIPLLLRDILLKQISP
ncbi:hypothetical protein CDAR_242651 [Caerostris darwini]|uniref:Secreted protein n=1 Tax=Caerostris darwini TaxID=1538125 RepID=A0AAV4N192_9ARAC|nr:hypothetical protein CDAR_242651 [Caerostris darwini]